jgi:hypothetical protein
MNNPPTARLCEKSDATGRPSMAILAGAWQHLHVVKVSRKKKKAEWFEKGES